MIAVCDHSDFKMVALLARFTTHLGFFYFFFLFTYLIVTRIVHGLVVVRNLKRES